MRTERSDNNLCAVLVMTGALLTAGAVTLSAATLMETDISGSSGPLAGSGGWIGRDDAIQLNGKGRAVLSGKSDGFAKKPVAMPPGTARIRLDARVRFAAMPGSAMRNHHVVGKEQPAWIAFGFMDNASEKTGLVAAKVSVSVSSDGQTTSIGLGRSVGKAEPVYGVYQTAGTGDCELALEVDFAAGTATALLDGKPVLSAQVKLSPADFTMAGFHLRRIAPDGGVVNMAVEYQAGLEPSVSAPAARPEPDPPFGSRINAEHERARRIEARIDGAQTAEEILAALKEGWEDPPATYRPHTRWWWPGNAVTKEGLTWQLEQMKEQGHGGVEPMAFRKIYEKGNIEFDSDEFVEVMKYVVDECHRLGMYVTPPLFPGWGHGSSRVAPEHRSKALIGSGADVDGGVLALTVPLPAKGQTLEVEFSHFMASQAKRLEAVVAVALDTNGTPDPSRRIDLTDSIRGERGWSVSPNVTIAGELPPGRWRLMAFWTSFTGQNSTAQNFEPRSYILDHLDADAVQSYLSLQSTRFLDAFGADYGQTVDSYFGDSFEITQGFSYWSEGLFERFEQMKGYDLKPYLPLLVYDGAPETPYIRHDMGHFLHRIGMESLVGPLSDHCEKMGIHMRQQPHYRFTTDIIAASGVFQRPETENTKRSFDPMFWHKLTTSGAWLYPSEEKKWVSAEAFTFINVKYRTSMEEIKQATDLFLRDGITQFYNHGYFYTPEKEIAPSRDLIWMNRISHVNTWWPWYRGLADYQARAAFLSRQGRAESDVLVYAPYPTLWSERSEYPVKHVRDLAFGHLPKTLVANGYDFDVANDDLLLNHAEIRDGRLVINGYDYSVLILPRVLCLAPETLEKIGRFAEAGGTVFALNTLPAYSDGWENREARDAALAAGRDRLFAAAGGERSVGQGRTWFMPECDGFDYLDAWRPGAVDAAPTPPLSPAYKAFIAALRSRLTPDFEMADKAQSDGLTFRRTVIGEVDCWFICNLQPHPRNTRITLKTKGKVPQIWDAMDRSIRAADSFAFAPDGRMMLDVDLEPWESRFVLLTPPGSVEMPLARPQASARGTSIALPGLWKVSLRGVGDTEANLTMEALQDWRSIPGLENFSGTATYEATFELQPGAFDGNPGIRLDLGEVCDVATVVVNGGESGQVWMTPYRVDISGQARPGVNTLKVIVANRLWNHTAGLKEPKPIPEELHAQYGSTWDPQYNGWNSMVIQRKMLGDLLPSGLLGPVRIERME